jgi:hypothetical protein
MDQSDIGPANDGRKDGDETVAQPPLTPLPSSDIRRPGRSSEEKKLNLPHNPFKKNSSMPSPSTHRIHQPPFPHSADSLLHHLHTDPQSSHMTVCGAASPVAHRHAALPAHDGSGATELASFSRTSSNGLLSGTISPVISEGGTVRPRQDDGRPTEKSANLGLMGKPVNIFPSTPPVKQQSGLQDREDSKKPEDKGAFQGEVSSNSLEASREQQQQGIQSSTPGSPARESSRPSHPVPSLSKVTSAMDRSRPSTAPASTGRKKSGILLPASTNEPSDRPLPSGPSGSRSRSTSGSNLQGSLSDQIEEDGVGTGGSTPSGQQGEKDKKGKAKIRPSANTTSVRSRTSTSSSLHLGPLPGSSAGLPVFGDGLITPSTDGHTSAGTDMDADYDPTTVEDENQERWPAEHVWSEVTRLKEEAHDQRIATTTMMSPARPASVVHSRDGNEHAPTDLSDSTGMTADASLPESADSSHQIKVLNDRLKQLEMKSLEMEDDVSTPMASTRLSYSAPQQNNDSCLHQFVQEFQSVVQQNMNHERGSAEALAGAGTFNPVASNANSQTKLVGSAGSLLPEGKQCTIGSRHMQSHPVADRPHYPFRS